ncbi:MAG: transketolase, partial [Planctomycetota bacterium]|nr:transketolase [Planctomycetota bacterium]
VFWDDNRITIDGTTDLSFTEDVGARFESYGWHVLRVDVSEGVDAYVAATDAARAETARPTLVCCRTHIGEGSPNKQDTSAAHGAPFGDEEIRLTKAALGWPEDASFEVPEDVAAHMRTAGRRGQAAHQAWSEALEACRAADGERAAQFERALAGELPADWEAALPSFEAGASIATRKASGATLAALGAVIPELVGGSCDLAGSNNTTIPGAADVTRDDFAGRTLHFGVREHAMGAILNGMALHGGFRPYGGTFLVFSDYMRGSIRLAALMNLPVVYVLTHDSIGVGEDGPTHQPIEHVASLRAMPGLAVVRPADAAETAEAWRMALTRAGPTVLCLTRQGLPVVDRHKFASVAGTQRGAYVLREGAVNPDVVLLATGSEVTACMGAAALLQNEGVAARVVSMPCWEAFDELEAEAREAVFSGCDVRVGVEAGCSLGWHRWVGPTGALVTLDRFGASAPADVLMEKFGFTAEHVAATARQALAEAEARG